MKRGVLIILVLLVLLFSLGGLVFFISQRTTFFGQAFGPVKTPKIGGQVAIENSYLFASPLRAKANGQEKIRVTVFILDFQGKGVTEEAVFLGQHEQLTITSVQPVTDELGRAIFDISATRGGEYLIEARAGNQVLPQRVKLSFYDPGSS